MDNIVYDMFGKELEEGDKIITASIQDSWHPDLAVFTIILIEFYTKTCKVFYKRDNDIDKPFITVKLDKEGKYQTNKILKIISGQYGENQIER